MYEGQWENEKKHGQGSTKLANGDTYVGAHQMDKKHGFGIFKLHVETSTKDTLSMTNPTIKGFSSLLMVESVMGPG